MKKQGDLKNSLILLGVTRLWQVAQRVSRAPTHDTLPAFLNLNGRILKRGHLWFSMTSATLSFND